jgi:peptidoglycan/LPS O-acetylase OafA/YrhL
VLMYLPAFALGSWNAHSRWQPGPAVGLASLGAFVLFTAVIAAFPVTEGFLDKTRPHPFDQDWFSMLWMLPLIPYVAASLTKTSTRFDRDVGNWSYPLYLVHVPLIALCEMHHQTKWIGVALAPVVALLLFYGLDRRFERLRRWVLNSGWRLNKPATATP